jgi:putative two-component system response regulator
MAREYIICVDDERVVVQSLKQELKLDPFFRDIVIEISDSPREVPSLVEEIVAEGGDLLAVISDQRMPLMAGDELLVEIHRRLPHTHKILLTGYADIEAIVRLVNANALYRYIAKPWDWQDMILTIKDACLAFRQRRMIETLSLKIESMTYAMVAALENANLFFDEETGNHVRRISLLSEFIGKRAGVDEQFVKMVKLYSPLHDIGKVGVRKEILNKPGRLTAEEFEHIKEHVRIGHRIIDDRAIDEMAKNIVLYHHEKWAGGGYAHGLAGEEIPLEARIVSIADVFDALVSKRVYKSEMSLDEALAIMRRERGVSFDPALLDPFVAGIEAIRFPDDLYGVTPFE